HHRLGTDLDLAALVASDYAPHHTILFDQRYGRRLVVDGNASLDRSLVLEINQARPATPRLDREAAPELVLTVHLEGLAAIAWLEAHALGAHPFQRLEAPANQDVGQLGVAAVVGHAAHVVEKLVGAIAAEVDVALFVFG